MTCRELVEFLADYLAGDLPAEVRRVFEAHLGEEVNAPCARWMLELPGGAEHDDGSHLGEHCDHDGRRGQADGPGMDGYLKARVGRFAASESELQADDELRRPCSRAADHAEPHEPVHAADGHSEGHSWVSTTSTAMALTTCQ